MADVSNGAPESRGWQAGNHLLVRAGELVCALPLGSVRRVVRALPVHPLPGAAAELLGLAEFAGEPMPVLDLARLVDAPTGAHPSHPVTVVVWTGAPESRTMVGLSADAALELAEVAATALVGGSGGLVRGEVGISGQVVRVLDLEALGRER